MNKLLPNELKIQFGNAYHELHKHLHREDAECGQCRTYLVIGMGDMCDTGKAIIAKHLIFADTAPVMLAEKRVRPTTKQN